MSGIPRLSGRVAATVPWCLLDDGLVHRAFWLTDGWLYVMVEEEHNFRRRAPLSDLRLGAVRPWRDRSKFNIPVCPVCQEDADIEEALKEI